MADEEAIDEDSDQFDCETCPVAAELDGLDPENRHAWHLYRQIACRFAADLHCGDTALARLTSDLDAEDFADVFTRLRVLYDVLNPPPDPPKG